MHPNRSFAWDDVDAMRRFVGAHPFARIIAATPGGLRIAHAPVIVTATGSLRFHLANANALTATLDGAQVLVVSEGPNAYVSANWYADTAGGVPTWNYVAVEAEGAVRRVGREELIGQIDALAALLEPTVGENWTRAKMDPARFDAMLGGITAFELAVSGWRGTRKLSQNKPDDEAARVIDGFARSGAAAMADAARAIRA